MEAWVFMGETSNWSRIVDIGTGATDNNIVLGSYGNTGRILFDVYNNGSSLGQVVSDEVLPSNRWVHIAATLNSDRSVNLYWDGVVKKTGTLSALPSETVRSNTWVGRSAKTADSPAYFKGAVRDLKIWNDARTAAEIRRDMSLAPSGSDDALAAWHPFASDSNSGAVLVGGARVTEVAVAGSVDADGRSREWVGTGVDSAQVLYSQRRSALTTASLTQTVSNPNDAGAGTATLTGQVVEKEPLASSSSGSSDWQVSYASNGRRNYTIQGLRTDLNGDPKSTTSSAGRAPDWKDNATFTASSNPGGSASVAYGSHRGNAPFLLGYTPRSNVDTFDSTAAGWAGTSGVRVTDNSIYGSFLGTYANTSKTLGQDIWKTYTLDGNGGTISFTLYRLDSWDNEAFNVYGNDQLIFSQTLGMQDDFGKIFSTNKQVSGYIGSIVARNDYANNWLTTTSADQTYDVSITVPAGVTSLKLGFGSSLNQASSDESYGIDNVAVTNATQIPALYAPSSSSNLNLDYIRSTAQLSNRRIAALAPRSVGELKLTSNAMAYLASSGSISNTDASIKATGLTVSSLDANGQQQRLNGFSRLARLTSTDEINAAKNVAAARSPQWYAVDGYQKTNDRNWLYYDGTPISTYFPSSKRYLTTTATDWLTASNIAIGMDGNLVKVDGSSTNAKLDTDFPTSWIGARRSSYGGSFSWSDGSALNYSNWAAGEPNNAGWPASTPVFSNNFESSSAGSNINALRSDSDYQYNTGNGLYLGRFGNDNGNDWDFVIGTNWGGGYLDSTKATKITFDFLRTDSWDEESFRMWIGRGDGMAGVEGAKTFRESREEATFTLINSNGHVATFTPTKFGQFLERGKWKDQRFSVEVFLPAGYGTWAIYFDGRTNDNKDDESYGIDNLVVSQSLGEAYAQMYDGGVWNDASASAILPGIVELTLPGLPWADGQPDDGGNTSSKTAQNEQNYLVLDANGKFADQGNTATWYLSEVDPVWGISRNLDELFSDYLYDWTSVLLDVSDSRTSRAYMTTSTVTPIVETQPLYHQEDVTSVVTTNELVPRMLNQTVYSTQTVTTGVSTSTTTDYRLSAAVPFNSLKGQRVSISTSGSSATAISGSIRADSTSNPTGTASLTIRSGGTLSLGDGEATSVSSTLMASSQAYQGKGLTWNSDALLTGLDGAEVQDLNLDAGSGALSLLSSPAPVASLSLSGASLTLPASTRTSLWAHALNLNAGLSVNVSQAEAAGRLQLAMDKIGRAHV